MQTKCPRCKTNLLVKVGLLDDKPQEGELWAKKKPAGQPIKGLTPVQRIILAYKRWKNYADDDKDWDKLYFPRYSKSAKHLLDFFGGDLDKAFDCMEALATDYDAKNLTWTLETIVKNAEHWRYRNGQTSGMGAFVQTDKNA